MNALSPMERTQLAEELSGLLGEPTTTLLRTALSDTALRAIHARLARQNKPEFTNSERTGFGCVVSEFVSLGCIPYGFHRRTTDAVG